MELHRTGSDIEHRERVGLGCSLDSGRVREGEVHLPSLWNQALGNQICPWREIERLTLGRAVDRRPQRVRIVRGAVADGTVILDVDDQAGERPISHSDPPCFSGLRSGSRTRTLDLLNDKTRLM